MKFSSYFILRCRVTAAWAHAALPGKKKTKWGYEMVSECVCELGRASLGVRACACEGGWESDWPIIPFFLVPATRPVTEFVFLINLSTIRGYILPSAPECAFSWGYSRIASQRFCSLSQIDPFANFLCPWESAWEPWSSSWNSSGCSLSWSPTGPEMCWTCHLSCYLQKKMVRIWQPHPLNNT